MLLKREVKLSTQIGLHVTTHACSLPQNSVASLSVFSINLKEKINKKNKNRELLNNNNNNNNNNNSNNNKIK